MRSLIGLAVCALVASAPANCEILYARPDGDPAGAVYRWGSEIVSDALGFNAAINIARAANGSRALEIRLLHRVDAHETLYSVDLRSIRSALKWQGSEANRLIIRGQTDKTGAVPRALTTIVGGSLRTILCEPGGVDVCAASSHDGANDTRQDLLDYLSGEMEERGAVGGDRSAAPDARFRLNCLLIWDSAFVEIAEMGFRECWLAAVATYASSEIAFRNSVIDGSTYAFAAIARQGVPESAHTFEITGNVWRQSPSEYRAAGGPCDIHNDWTCAVSVWSDVPWAVVHHHFWSPLNGALFTAKDILGNVRIADNYVTDAYNGIRVRLSKTCLADPSCRAKANAGFEIVGNTFERIRDNPVEPEGHAAFWVIKHNTFVNVYAAISTDGVSGHDFLVFGNIFALDEVPGATCRDEGWVGSRQFRLTLGGGGGWSKEGAQGEEAQCSTHVLGTVVKLGADERNPGAPLLERIFFFNNSLRTRSPLFRGSPAPPITSYNNAVAFTGCGRFGAPSCRQEPVFEPSCGKDVWTSDDDAVYAACFPTRDINGRSLSHRMRYNAFNRPPGPQFDDIEQDRVTAPVAFPRQVASAPAVPTAIVQAFAIGPASALATGGCALRYENGDLKCAGAAGPVGAMLPDGRRFDLDLPFRFPFVDVLRHLGERSSPNR